MLARNARQLYGWLPMSSFFRICRLFLIFFSYLLAHLILTSSEVAAPHFTFTLSAVLPSNTFGSIRISPISSSKCVLPVSSKFFISFSKKLMKNYLVIQHATLCSSSLISCCTIYLTSHRCYPFDSADKSSYPFPLSSSSILSHITQALSSSHQEFTDYRSHH